VIRGETWIAPGLVETRVALGEIAFVSNASGAMVAAQPATLTYIEPQDPVDALGRFLGVRVGRRIGRWWLWGSIDVFAMTDDEIRYFVPGAGFDLRAGDVRASLAAFSTGIYGAAIADSYGTPLPRALDRDFDIDAKVSVAQSRWLRIQARGRYRDGILRGQGRVRDVFAAVGVELAGPYGYYQRWLPSYVGIGMRRVIDREAPMIIERTEEPRGGNAGGWQVLLWLELDIGLDYSRPQ
jgi:hypothetical protein